MSSWDEKPEELRLVAEEAVRAAGAIALAGFRGNLAISSKGNKDIVTQYDIAAERAAIGVITRRFPHHSILAEESGPNAAREEASSRYQWTVDPIDGTHNYAMQLPFWCSSVAVADLEKEEVVAGAVLDAEHGELFAGSLGGGAFMNGAAMRVSQTSSIDDITLAFDIGYEEEVSRRMMLLAGKVQPQVNRVRLLGSAVLALTYVAAGRFDGYCHLNLQPWDIGAASLLVREAGGTITSWEGQALTIGRTSAVAANPHLQPQLLALLHSAESERPE